MNRDPDLALFLGPSGNRYADSFETLTYVDTVNSVNLDTGTAGILKPSTAGGLDANTLLLLHMDGTNGSTTFTDSSASARTVTAAGNAQISTAQSVFGGASALFDGTGDWLSVPDSADWNFGTGNFTVDLRFRCTSLASRQAMWGQWSDANNGFRLFVETTGVLSFDHWSGGSRSIILDSAAGAIVTNTWYHIAIVRNGTNLQLYKNGVSIASVTDADAINNFTGAFYIGQEGWSNGSLVTGNIDEFRVSNIARWTTGFTPPSAAYAAPATNNATIYLGPFAAAAVPSDAKGLLMVKEVDAAVADTDYELAVSRDGKSTWTDIPLTELYTAPTPTAGIRVVEGAETDISAQPSDDEVWFRFKTLNNKMVELHAAYSYWTD